MDEAHRLMIAELEELEDFPHEEGILDADLFRGDTGKQHSVCFIHNVLS